MLRLRPNLILPISALFLFGGCSSCFGPEDQQGCISDSAFASSSCADDWFEPCSSSSPSSTSTSSTCTDIFCCIDEDRGAERLSKYLAEDCGCAPFVACEDRCFADHATAARCGADGGGSKPLENTACVDCVLQGEIDPACATHAHDACAVDDACSTLVQCLDRVGWPEETTSTGGSSSVSNTGGSSSSRGGGDQGGASSFGGASSQGGAGGSSGGGGHTARARR